MRRAIVIGAGSSIGEGVVSRLATEKVRVVGLDIDFDSVRAVSDDG